jgi:hypothetical protein
VISPNQSVISSHLGRTPFPHSGLFVSAALSRWFQKDAINPWLETLRYFVSLSSPACAKVFARFFHCSIIPVSFSAFHLVVTR